jgi:TetR/AcrR family fatty acid metabolism transcriptional regulator
MVVVHEGGLGMPDTMRLNAIGKTNKVTKRALQAIETRNRIYAAAVRMMERNGFDNITIEQISKAAKVSVGAFYHHFGSKNDILNEIFRRADDFFREHVVGKLSGATAAEKIVSYFDHYARFNVLLGVDHIRALYKTQSNFFINGERLMVTALRDMVAAGLETKELVSDLGSEEITDFLFATARGLAYTWCLHNGTFSLEDRMRRYMACQVQALVR